MRYWRDGDRQAYETGRMSPFFWVELKISSFSIMSLGRAYN